MRRERTVTVYEVLYVLDDSGGACEDGSRIARFRDRGEATRFAASHRGYSGPATVGSTEAPRSLAQRWGVA